MKRKFGFSITPVKSTPKPELQPTVLRPPSPVSPIFYRRQLPPDVEAELRKACAVILQDFKPSSQMYEEQVLAATFASLQKSSYISSSTEQRSWEPRRGEASAAKLTEVGKVTNEMPLPLDTSKYRYKPKSALKDLFEGTDSTHTHVQASIVRQQDSSQSRPTYDPLTPTATATNRSQRDTTRQSRVKTPVHERPRTANRGESYDTSSSTPRTVASDYHSTSTALTSAMQTPAGSSKRASKHIMPDPQCSSKSRADATAAQWMRQELEKRGGRSDSQQRPPSRGSIRSGISEYFRPGSSLSRSSSRNSDRLEAPARPSTATGWRSWSLTRKRSNSSIRDSRSSSSKGRREAKGTEAQEVNLNRELPPLPGLDTYDEKRATPKMHIAALMRPKKNHRPEAARFADEPPAERGRSTTVQRRTDHQLPHPSNKMPATNIRHTAQKPRLPESSTRMPFLDFLPPPVKTNGTLRPSTAESSSDGSSNGRSGQTSSEKHHSGHISLDQYSNNNPSMTSFDRTFRNAVHINTIQTPKANKSKPSSRSLRAVFGLNKKQQKQADWMAKMERLGIRGGVVEEFGQGPAVVRF